MSNGPASGSGPVNPNMVLNSALDCLGTGGEAEAVPRVVGALREHPRDARLWQVLGLLHRAQDDPAAAIPAFANAAKLAPDDARIAHGQARVNLEAGKPASAFFARALQLAPRDEAVRLGLLEALLAEGRAQDALAWLEQAIGSDPTWAGGHAALARLRWRLGDHATFTASIEIALQGDPLNLGLWRELIGAKITAERYEDALEAIEKGRAAAGAHLLFDVYEAASLSELGRLDAADRLFTGIGPIADHTVTVHHLRHLLRVGRADAAARLAEPWMATPQAAAIWPYLSLAWRLREDPRWHWLEGDPKLVGIYDVPMSEGALQALAGRLRALHTTTAHPLDQSLRGGTQTDGPLFSRAGSEIRALRKAIVESVEAHVAQLPPAAPSHPTLALPRDKPIRFSGSWSVRLVDGGHHVSHTHPGGWFSSAFYVSLPGEDERGAPPAGWLALGEPPPELGLGLPPVRLVEPKPGRLVLFPSTMWHSTRPFGAGERLTVAFDVALPS
jgi:tetratricopeptide (TPR) repeat protein